MNEYLKTCFFADKLFNEYFDNYIFRKKCFRDNES